MNIFDFSFNVFSIFPALTAIANIYLLYLLNTKVHQTAITKYISVFIIFAIISGFGDFLVRSSASPFAADYWELLNLPVMTLFGTMIVTIALAYTGQEKLVSKLGYQLAVFGVPATFLFIGLTTPYFQNRDLSNFKHYYYGWNDSGDSALFWIYIALMFLANLIAIIILINNHRKITNSIKKKQSLLFILAFFIPILAGFVFDGIIQALYGPIFPLMSIASTSLTGIVLSFAIIKYKLFIVNPSMIATNIIDTMNEMLIVFNPSYNVLFANQAVESVLRYNNNQLNGVDAKSLIFDSWDKFRDNVVVPINKGSAVSGVEMDLRSIDGDRVPIAFSASSILDNEKKVAGIVGVATDLRKLKSLTATFEQTKSRLQAIDTIVNSVVNGIIVLDFNNRIVLANKTILTLLNIAPRNVLNKNVDEVLVLKEFSKKIPIESLTSNETGLVTRKNLEILTNLAPNIPKDPIIVDVVSTPIANGHEFALSSMLVFIDRTKEVQLEEMKIDFVSMAAHELRTPLTSIQGYVSMLIDDLSPTLSQESKDQLERLSVSANNLNSLIENLLNVSKIESGSLKTKFDPVDLVGIAKETIDLMQSQANIKRQSLIFKNPNTQLPLVLADRYRIGEVIQNLLANAINYTKEQGEISIELYVKDNFVIFKIQDNGQGIPRAALPNLFSKFFRVGGKLEQGSKGTGLGLFISKSIINLHKGDIWAESTLGEGSIFYFRLPIPDKQALEKASADNNVLKASEYGGIFRNENRK